MHHRTARRGEIGAARRKFHVDSEAQVLPLLRNVIMLVLVLVLMLLL